MDSYERVHEHLSTLGMDTIEKTIDNYLENARDKGVMRSLMTDRSMLCWKEKSNSSMVFLKGKPEYFSFVSYR